MLKVTGVDRLHNRGLPEVLFSFHSSLSCERSRNYSCNFVGSFFQLLKGVTIAAGGVLPNIHPELLAKKRGAKGKLETPLSPAPEKKPKPVKKTAAKKMSAKKSGGKAKVLLPVNTPAVVIVFVGRVVDVMHSVVSTEAGRGEQSGVGRQHNGGISS